MKKKSKKAEEPKSSRAVKAKVAPVPAKLSAVRPKTVRPDKPAKPVKQALGANELAALAYAKLREAQGGDAAGFPPWQQLLENTRATYVAAAEYALKNPARTAFERHVQAIARRQ